MNSPAPEPAAGSAADSAAEREEASVDGDSAAPETMPSAEARASPALDLGLAVALATALVYTAGWAYAYRWFARFDLGLNALELPAETLLMYGFWTLRAHWVLLFAYGPGLALWVWHGPRVRLWLLRTAPFWLLGAFGLAYAAGGASADSRFAQHRAAGFGCFPQARVGLIPSPAAPRRSMPSPPSWQSGNTGCSRRRRICCCSSSPCPRARRSWSWCRAQTSMCCGSRPPRVSAGLEAVLSNGSLRTKTTYLM